jgi:tetratricopeptide (TPR) repeat protein
MHQGGLTKINRTVPVGVPVSYSYICRLLLDWVQMSAVSFSIAAATESINIVNRRRVSSANLFQKLGVKLSYLKEFIEECGGRDQFRDLITTEVSARFIRPMTLRIQDSYCNLLRARRHTAVSVAAVFISHAWKYPFLDVVEALQYHFRDQPDIVIWFDLFSNNQHSTESRPFEWWCGTFKSAIAEFGHVVMVMAPWSNPIPLTRAWCLFELYCIADMSHGKFEVAMSKLEQAKFLDVISADPEGEIGRMSAVIDCEKSESINPEDRDSIFATVRRVVGFATINKMIFEQLRQWMVTVTETAINQEVAEDRKLLFEFTLAQICHNQGKYSKAEPVYLSCLEKRKALFGEMHPETLRVEYSLGVVFIHQAKLSLAEPLYVSNLRNRKAVLGETHPDTLCTQNNLAMVYSDQGKYEASEVLYASCLQKRITILGDTHPDTLRSMNNLAHLHQRQGKYDAAEPLYVSCIEKKKILLGDNHPDTLRSVCNLALVHLKQGKSEAEPMQVSCLEKRRIVLGENHPETLISMSHLALWYSIQGKYVAAERMTKSCLEKRKTTLGDSHPYSLVSLCNLAFLYMLQGEFEVAESLCLACIEKRVTVLGSDHPDTISSRADLAFLYAKQSKYEVAEPLFAACLEPAKELLNNNHPEALTLVNNLGVVYYYLQNYSQAETMLLLATQRRKITIGEDHFLTLLSIKNLAKLYERLGKLEQAEALLVSCARKERANDVGERHYDVLRSLRIA